MEFIGNLLSYLLYLVYGLISNILNLVPLGSILDLLGKINADTPIVTLNTIIHYFTNGQEISNNTFIIRGLASIALIGLIFFGIALAIYGIKYLYGNIADYLFRYKYKGLTDKETAEVLEHNILTGNNITNTGNKIDISRRGLILSYKGFAGLILSRFHAWKESKLGIGNSAEGNNVRNFGVFTFLTLYLFGFMNRKELKEFRFLGMVMAFITTIVVGGLFLNYSNMYELKVFHNNQTDKTVGNIYVIKDQNNFEKPSIDIEGTNIIISNFSDIYIYSLLTMMNIGVNKHANNINLALNKGDLDLKEGLRKNILVSLDAIKQLPDSKNKFLKKRNIYPDYYYKYVQGEINKSEFTQFFNETPMFLNATKGFQLMITYFSMVETGKEDKIDKVLGILDDISSAMYKWKEYKNIYSITNENKSLITLQKIVYYLNFIPFINPNVLITKSQAQKQLGIVNNETLKNVHINTNPLVANGEETLKRIDDLRKRTNNKKVLEGDKVANPNYVYRVLGIFPVYPISTSKGGTLAYFFFIIIVAIIQLIFFLFMLGLGRFVYLYLVYTMLDDNQKGNFNIDWQVEITDTFIRIIVTLIIYIYIVQYVMLDKII